MITAAANELEEHGAPSVFTEENEKLVKSLETLGNDVAVDSGADSAAGLREPPYGGARSELRQLGPSQPGARQSHRVRTPCPDPPAALVRLRGRGAPIDSRLGARGSAAQPFASGEPCPRTDQIARTRAGSSRSRASSSTPSSPTSSRDLHGARDRDRRRRHVAHARRGGAAAPRRRPRTRGRDGLDRRPGARRRLRRYRRPDLRPGRRADARPALERDRRADRRARADRRRTSSAGRSIATRRRSATSRRRSRPSRRASRSSTSSPRT